ncbi:hypothetical protein BG842_23850 [Haladaptatus sp. W1]|nr:hypothetical protein BG842_23850 [Haladaptatus sp. W1]
MNFREVPPPRGRNMSLPCGTEGYDRHHRVLGGAAADVVAVPGDAVGPVAVVTQSRGGERLPELASVVVVQCIAGLVQCRMRPVLPLGVVPNQARHIDHAVVHLPAFGAPVDVGDQ